MVNDSFQFPSAPSTSMDNENPSAATSLGESFNNCSFADHASSSQSSFRILSQTVRINELSFADKSFRVFTELVVVNVKSGESNVVLDLGNYCVLPNEEGFRGIGRVTVNNFQARYLRNRVKMPPGPNIANKSVLNLKNIQRQALASYPGDLIIEIPEECAEDLANQTVLRVGIDLMVVSPKEGINFVAGSRSDQNESAGSHMYTYRSRIYSSTKEWLPCLESPNQLAVWRFEVTVDSKFTAVCCGDLIDTIPCAEDESQKTFHYQLLLPTSAANIGFVVGDFQMHVHPDIPEIISFALPGLMPLLKHTVSTLNRTYTFFEELLACRFPYGFYRQVFVNQVPDELTSYASLSILSLDLLYHKKILDQVLQTRQALALAIAQQFFGCFVNPESFGELWLVKSLARFINGLFVERSFGSSEYMHQINKMLKAVCDYEMKFGKIVVSPPLAPGSAFSGNRTTVADLFTSLHFDPSRPETCSTLYADALYKKGHYVMRMLQKRLGSDQFIKVLHRILSVAMQYSQQLMKPIDWFHMVISSDSFFRTVTNVTSREFPTFIEQWIHTGGHVSFQVSHTYNRKHSKLELEIKQSTNVGMGLQSYIGPLTIVVQEVDGCFSHTVQVDATISKHDLPCHSKGRRQKKKRIPLLTGEEIEIDLSQMDADSPVLWIRIDPEMLILRQLQVTQAAYQWEYMLRHERDVLAQLHAIEMLQQYPVHQTATVLSEIVENERLFYKVRNLAARRLVDISNRLPEALMQGTQTPLIGLFQRLFCCKNNPSLPQSNNYVATSSNLQHYFLMLGFLEVVEEWDLPMAIAGTRANGGKTCPPEVLDFLFGLINYNDNSINRYSDDTYRAALILALGSSLVVKEHASEQPLPETMSQEARRVLAEVTHALNMDTMKPSFGRVVGVRCLHVLSNLQRRKHIPLDLDVFWKFATCRGIYVQMRKSALDCIIATIRQGRNPLFVETLLQLVNVALDDDDDPCVRYNVAEKMCNHPPFAAGNDPSLTAALPMNSAALAHLLWNSICDMSLETRIRTLLTDLYFLLYGREMPLVLRSI